MKKYLIAGFLFFLACFIIFAPAGILDRLADQAPGIDLIEPRGTIWQGQAILAIQGKQRGTLDWQFDALSLFSLSAAYDWNLNNPNLAITGKVGASLDTRKLQLRGKVDAELINQWLDIYLITMSGEFQILPTQVTQTKSNQFRHLNGQIDWSGGLVRYTLAGVLYEVQLPPLTAYLDQNTENDPIATVYTQGGSTPLIMATLGKDGFAKVGMTKLFTKLLNNPWPGSHPDHVVILEVEEKIL